MNLLPQWVLVCCLDRCSGVLINPRGCSGFESWFAVDGCTHLCAVPLFQAYHLHSIMCESEVVPLKVKWWNDHMKRRLCGMPSTKEWAAKIFTLPKQIKCYDNIVWSATHPYSKWNKSKSVATKVTWGGGVGLAHVPGICCEQPYQANEKGNLVVEEKCRYFLYCLKNAEEFLLGLCEHRELGMSTENPALNCIVFCEKYAWRASWKSRRSLLIYEDTPT